MFSNLMESHLRRKAEIEQMLQSLDIHSDLAMVFQPIVNLQGARLASFEALARWNSGTYGIFHRMNLFRSPSRRVSSQT